MPAIGAFAFGCGCKCCPPQDGCFVASDNFARANGPVGPHWTPFSVTSTGPAIVDGELGSVAGGGHLIHCSRFPLSPLTGSLEIEVEGEDGDQVRLFTVRDTAGGPGIALEYEIGSDRAHFRLGSYGLTGGGFVSPDRTFQIPGGPGLRHRLRLCWFETPVGTAVAIGAVYDEAGELVFRDFSSSNGVALYTAAPLHGLFLSTSETLRVDNYLATIPDDSDYLCPPCELPAQPNLCLEVENNGCDIDELSAVLEPAGFSAVPYCNHPPVNAIHRAWAKATGGSPDTWHVQVSQEEDGTWIGLLSAQTSWFFECFRVVLIPAGAATPYPTTETLIALLTEATFVNTGQDGPFGGGLGECWDGVTATVSTNLEACGYYTGGDDECLRDDMPDELTIFVQWTCGGGGSAEMTATNDIGLAGGQTWGYQFNGVGGLGSFGGPSDPSDPGQTISFTGVGTCGTGVGTGGGGGFNVISCNPFFATFSLTASGGTISGTITE